MTSVAVVGAGAVGSYFAAHLLEAGTASVTLCVRRPFEELVVERDDGVVLRSRPLVATDPAGLEPVDWVLLATKAHQTEGAAGWLRSLVGPGTAIAVLHNGTEHEARVRPNVGDAAVVPAVVYCGAELLAPGHVQHQASGLLIVPPSPAAEQLAALFPDPKAHVRLSETFPVELWTKVTSNCVVNGICALTERRFEVFRDPAIATLARAVVAECATVAAAEGAPLADDLADRLCATLAASAPTNGSSMLYDRLARVPMEQDAIYGAVVRAGARHGLATPLTGAFLALLGAISAATP
ncbi:MAG: 2-dehydropantoate 2-reductase [Acidimicrobiales bacterium]